MGSGWSWCAAYVQTGSEKQVAQALQDTLKLETKGKVQLLLKENPKNASFGFAFTSPEKNGWVAVWPGMPVFCSWVFKRQGLSGLILSGFGEAPSEFLDDPFYDSSWMYSLWENGQIIDWFVRDPEYHFYHTWELKPTLGIILPYLSSKGIAIKLPEDRFGREFNFIIQNSREFSGNLAHLMPFVHRSLQETEVKEWLDLPAGQALYKASEILDIPFVGPEYFHDDIRNFFAMQNGISLPDPFLNYLEPGVQDRCERDENWKQVVATFNPYMIKMQSTYSDLDFMFDCLI